MSKDMLRKEHLMGNTTESDMAAAKLLGYKGIHVKDGYVCGQPSDDTIIMDRPVMLIDPVTRDAVVQALGNKLGIYIDNGHGRWSWRSSGGDYSEGMFDTYEEAIRDACLEVSQWSRLTNDVRDRICNAGQP